jgi:hypothetical protein
LDTGVRLRHAGSGVKAIGQTVSTSCVGGDNRKAAKFAKGRKDGILDELETTAFEASSRPFQTPEYSSAILCELSAFAVNLLQIEGLAGERPLCQFPRAMDLSSCLQMDPHLLVGLVNTELRNHCDSLDDLVKTHNLDHEALVGKLASADYIYQANQNQFR